MARIVEEIMNRELFSLRTSEPAIDALGFLIALGITGAPVVDDAGRPVGMLSLRDGVNATNRETVFDRMTEPVDTVPKEATIGDAARLLAESGRHRLVVVDDEGHAVGMLSAVDALRALLGLPVGHPEAFPHFDRTTGTSWSNDSVLDIENLRTAPDGPGVLVLVHGGAGIPERIVWAEPCSNVRTRLYDMLSAPQDDVMLAHTLRLGHLRFRAASVPDPMERRRVVDLLERQMLSLLRPIAYAV